MQFACSQSKSDPIPSCVVELEQVGASHHELRVCRKQMMRQNRVNDGCATQNVCGDKVIGSNACCASSSLHQSSNDGVQRILQRRSNASEGSRDVEVGVLRRLGIVGVVC